MPTCCNWLGQKGHGVTGHEGHITVVGHTFPAPYVVQGNDRWRSLAAATNNNHTITSHAPVHECELIFVQDLFTVYSMIVEKTCAGTSVWLKHGAACTCTKVGTSECLKHGAACTCMKVGTSECLKHGAACTCMKVGTSVCLKHGAACTCMKVGTSECLKHGAACTCTKVGTSVCLKHGAACTVRR